MTNSKNYTAEDLKNKDNNASVSLLGLTRTSLTKKGLKEFLKYCKNVKSYNEFGVYELVVYTSGYEWIAAIDINTNQVWTNQKWN